MRAIVFDGKVRLVRDYPRPEAGKGEALIRVRLAGVCATDLEISEGYMGFTGVLGHEFAGVVEKCAEEGLVGKRVVGEINIGCGTCAWCCRGLRRHCPQRSVLGIAGKDGAFAEYLTLPAGNLHVIPENVPDDEAVFTEPLAAAFEIAEQVRLGKDDRVCVLGDGRLGILVAQVVALSGCGLVASGRHEENLAILSARGIRTRLAAALNERDFDVVVDCTGSRSGFNEAIKLVRPRGTVVLKTTVAGRGETDLNGIVINEVTVVGSRCGPYAPALKALYERTVDVRPLVSGVFQLDDGVRAVRTAAKNGVLKVLIDCA